MTLTDLLKGQGLKARSLRAGALTLVRFGGHKVLQLVSNLILTRLLFPEAFGMMALVSIFVLGLELISDVGITPAIIRSSRSDEPVFQSTAWTLKIVRGGIITVFAWGLAWPYALIYGEPALWALICVASVSAFIKGFGSIDMILHERRLALGKLVIVQLVALGLATCGTIAMAWWLQSVWALTFGFVLSAILTTGAGLIFFPSPNHRFSWDRTVLHEILVFGRWILLGTLFTYLGGRGLSAVQGALIDFETLAFVTIAGTFSWMIGELISAVLGSVIFPAMSQIHRENPEGLAGYTRKIQRLMILGGIPGFLVLSLIAEPMIVVLYDDRYGQAGPFLALMALNSALAVIPMITLNAILASGDSRSHSFIMGLNAGLRIVGVCIGFVLGGVTGMIVGIACATCVVVGLVTVMGRRRGITLLSLDLPTIALILGVYALQLQGSI